MSAVRSKSKIRFQVSQLKFSACSLSLVPAHKSQPPVFAVGYLNFPTSRLMNLRRELFLSGPHPISVDTTFFFSGLREQQQKKS